MTFAAFFDWWIDNVTFGPFNLAIAIANKVDGVAGGAAAMGALVLFIPALIPLAFLGILLTTIPMIAAVLWLPLALCVAGARSIARDEP